VKVRNLTRLGCVQAGEAIREPENTIFVSAVSLWEIWLKQSLDKLRLPAEFEGKLAAGG
jgi:PIN domain nuclease of toxin-antitoxin system